MPPKANKIIFLTIQNGMRATKQLSIYFLLANYSISFVFCACFFSPDSSQRPISFNGGSFVRYDNLQLSTTSTQLSTAFQTQGSNGVIMHAEGDYDFSTLEVRIVI